MAGGIIRSLKVRHRRSMLVSERQIKITAGSVVANAALNGTATADLIWDALPIEAFANTWGDEIYFGIPVSAGDEAGQEVVELGDLGYWPPGNAFCIFFGPTPMSRGDEIRPASPVTVVGKIRGNHPTVFKQVSSGAPILIERA